MLSSLAMANTCPLHSSHSSPKLFESQPQIHITLRTLRQQYIQEAQRSQRDRATLFQYKSCQQQHNCTRNRIFENVPNRWTSHRASTSAHWHFAFGVIYVCSA